MANFTVATAAFPSFPTFSVEVATATANVTLPMLTLVGVATSPHGELAVSLPAIQAVGYGAANSTMALPMLRAYGTGRESHNDLNVSLPAFQVSAFAGANSGTSLPMLTAEATGTVTGIGKANVTLAALTITGSGVVAYTANADIALPAVTALGYTGAVLSVTLQDGFVLQASGTTGGVGSLTATLPAFEVSAIGTAQTYGTADITLPAITVGTTGRLDITLPGFTLTAIGTATITATYEAYALNMSKSQRSGGSEPGSEVTYYTNFPFTHVVRYKNSYYGANSTGLYLLEGTTDDGIPIEWEFKTGMSDFDTPQQKTVTYAYFGGRLGPSATVTIYPSEPTGTSYSYTTPRGQTAQNYRQQFGKGLKARYFAIGASGTDVIELDSIDLTVATLTRRI